MTATIEKCLTACFSPRKARLALLVGSLLANAVLAQGDIDFDRLIFEPVLLTAEQVAHYKLDTSEASADISSATATDSEFPEKSRDAGAAEPDGSSANTGAAREPLAANSAETLESALPPEIARARAAELKARIASNEARINDLITAENTYSQSLREQYEALADLQQQSGDHEAAVVTLENAMHIERVNSGLFTLSQLPLVQKIIASHSALGNLSDVADHQEYLYYIQVKAFAPEDPRLLAAKEAWADWNVEAYLKDEADGGFAISMNTGAGAAFGRGTDYVAIQNPRTGAFNYVPRNQLPFVLGNRGLGAQDLYLNSSAYAVPPETIIDERLRMARDLYQDIIDVRPDGDVNASYSAEHKLANIALIVKRQIDAMESSSSFGSLGYTSVTQPRTTSRLITRGYTENREALEEIATRLEQNAGSAPVEAARAWIDVGDWHVAYDRSSRGEEAYRKAWQLLQTAGLDKAGIEAVFAPRALVPVPEFATHPYSRSLFGIATDTPLDYKGYIDTSLTVDRRGRVRGVTIENVSQNTTQRLRSDLLDYLRETRVRPAVIDGETVEQSGLNVRFYYTY